MGKRIYILFGLLLVLIIAGVCYGRLISSTSRQQGNAIPPTPQLTATKDELIYNGKAGETAQALLISLAPVVFDKSGMVSGINNRIADPTKHEYWALYVNGKMSPVGASSYVTKNTDKIEWKIEKY